MHFCRERLKHLANHLEMAKQLAFKELIEKTFPGEIWFNLFEKQDYFAISTLMKQAKNMKVNSFL